MLMSCFVFADEFTEETEKSSSITSVPGAAKGAEYIVSVVSYS